MRYHTLPPGTAANASPGVSAARAQLSPEKKATRSAASNAQRHFVEVCSARFCRAAKPRVPRRNTGSDPEGSGTRAARGMTNHIPIWESVHPACRCKSRERVVSRLSRSQDDVQCTSVKGFTVAEARARFGDLLDQAEQGDAVVIERRGVRFVLQAERRKSVQPQGPYFEWLDAAVEAGEWTWDLTSKGAKFRARRRRSRR